MRETRVTPAIAPEIAPPAIDHTPPTSMSPTPTYDDARGAVNSSMAVLKTPINNLNNTTVTSHRDSVSDTYVYYFLIYYCI